MFLRALAAGAALFLVTCGHEPPDQRQEIIKNSIAQKLGTPYQWGGSSYRGLDCSGFVRAVYKQVKIDLPHSAARQFEQGHSVRYGELEYGDVVFFNNRPLRSLSGCCFPCLACGKSVPLVYSIDHNGIYVGEGKFAHSSTSSGVRIDKLTDDYWKDRYAGARRYLD